ncbi:hypothetical protein SynPROS71_00292 [Synechococcus sp. PROS-7-1]|nr:hypothetical protein SynPROS71_00292 [Synechococcus sp. PROS-7-1]
MSGSHGKGNGNVLIQPEEDAHSVDTPQAKPVKPKAEH